MSVCSHCKSRNGWECGDGWALPKDGCEYFSLDFDTLTPKQQKAIRRILSHENDRSYDDDY